MNSKVSENDYVYIKCNLCGNDDYDFFGVNDLDKEWVVHRTRVKCKRCGLVYSNPQATSKRLREFYINQYDDKFLEITKGTASYAQLADKFEGNHRRFFKELNKRMQAGRFLDIGCATGHLLKIGEKFGWDVYGIELAKERVLFAKEKLGLQNVYPVELKEAKFESGFFDCVYMWHVLEHVQDPTDTLLEIQRVLKKNGELIIGVPSIYEPFYHISRFCKKLKGKPPGMGSVDHHTFDFTPNTLVKMLKKSGFKIKKIRVYYNPLNYVLQQYNMKWKTKLVFKFFWYLGNKILRNRFGHRIEAVVSK